MKTVIDGVEYNIELQIETNNCDLSYQIHLDKDGESDFYYAFGLDDIELKQAHGYLIDSFKDIYNVVIDETKAKLLIANAIKNTVYEPVYYLIEARKHSGYVERHGLYYDLDDMWESIRAWELPVEYIIDQYDDKESLMEFLEDINFPGKIPEVKFPLTIYCEGEFSFDSYDENYNYYDIVNKGEGAMSPKLKEFLWEAHYHDYANVNLYKIENHQKIKIENPV